MTKIELGILVHQKFTQRNNSPKCTVIFASCDDVTVTCKDTDLAALDDSFEYNPELQTITYDHTSIKVKLN